MLGYCEASVRASVRSERAKRACERACEANVRNERAKRACEASGRACERASMRACEASERAKANESEPPLRVYCVSNFEVCPILRFAQF